MKVANVVESKESSIASEINKIMFWLGLHLGPSLSVKSEFAEDNC